MSERISTIVTLKEKLDGIRTEIVTANQSETPSQEFHSALDDLLIEIEQTALNGTAQEANRLIDVVNAATALARCRREILAAFENDLTVEVPRFRGNFWSAVDAVFSAIEKARYEPRPPQFDSVLTMAKQGLPLNQICICWPMLQRAEIQNLIASGDASKDTDPAQHPDVIAWHAAQAKRPRLVLAPLIGEVAQIRFDRQEQCAAAS